MRYSIIDGSDVVNVIEWDGEQDYEAPDGLILVSCPDEVSVGWTVTSDGFIAPPEPPQDAEAIPYEDPAILEAKNSALAELVALGVTASTARIIVGLPEA